MQTHNLPPPYATECGAVPLKYHTNYNQKSCLLEKLTDFIARKCKCREPYMPGKLQILKIDKFSFNGLWKLTNIRSSRPEVFCKKGGLKYAKFSSATLLGKRFRHRCFPVNFGKYLRTRIFKEHFRWLLRKYFTGCGGYPVGIKTCSGWKQVRMSTRMQL